MFILADLVDYFFVVKISLKVKLVCFPEKQPVTSNWFASNQTVVVVAGYFLQEDYFGWEKGEVNAATP